MKEVEKDIHEIKVQIGVLVKSMEELKADTRGVVELYNTTQGAIKAGIAVQKIGIWMLKWPLIGTGMYAAYTWVLERFVQ